MLFLCRFSFFGSTFVCVCGWAFSLDFHLLFFLLFTFFSATFGPCCQNTGFRYLNVVSHFEFALYFFFSFWKWTNKKKIAFFSANEDPNGNCYRWWTTTTKPTPKSIHATQPKSIRKMWHWNWFQICHHQTPIFHNFTHFQLNPRLYVWTWCERTYLFCST